ncbi:MAG TPA: hypothetical protein EYP58_05875 [bacterium (Candidatus Stahlbacteria)]|nr:hypothetical protein [Candidatus Stahlbacteria bacterium]
MIRKNESFIIFCSIIICYILTNYGGIRSPDNEITFRVGESIGSYLRFSVEKPLSWQGFGVARGKDGRFYSVFGPLESIILMPIIGLSNIITNTDWYKNMNIPPSHYLHNGLQDFLLTRRPKDLKPHTLRFIVSYLFIPITLFGLIFLYLIMRQFASKPASIWATTLSALGTIIWAYSGTLFSEPLAILLILISLYFLIKEGATPLFAGIFLGMATMAHITSILFAPFFLIYLILKRRKIIKYLIGLAIPLLLLGIYNHIRFGNPFETGRTADLFGESRYIYSYFVAPWQGLYGLLLSAGKGLIVYSPAVILGIIGWRSLHKKDRTLSFTLIGAIVFRIIFIASRSDWPGGFCLGPRYLLPILPFLILPVAPWLDGLIERKSHLTLSGLFIVTFLCILQQLYFNLGEIFSYFHLMRFKFLKVGIDIFKNHQIYFNWQISPISHILKGKPGPFLLQQTEAIAKATTLTIGILIIIIILFLGLILLNNYQKESTQ